MRLFIFWLFEVHLTLGFQSEVSTFIVFYKNEMKNELDKFIITAYYCLMKQGFTVKNAIEGMGRIFCLLFYIFYF